MFLEGSLGGSVLTECRRLYISYLNEDTCMRILLPHRISEFYVKIHIALVWKIPVNGLQAWGFFPVEVRLKGYW